MAVEILTLVWLATSPRVDNGDKLVLTEQDLLNESNGVFIKRLEKGVAEVQ